MHGLKDFLLYMRKLAYVLTFDSEILGFLLRDRGGPLEKGWTVGLESCPKLMLHILLYSDYAGYLLNMYVYQRWVGRGAPDGTTNQHSRSDK